jgi:hypothetical protein
MILNTLSAAFVALALTGCVTLKGEHRKALHGLIGTPVSAVEARYGRPLAVGGGELEYTIGRGVGVVMGVQTSTVSGYAGTTPFYGTVSTPTAHTYATFCRLRVRLDFDRNITAVGLSGHAKQCREGLKGLY